MRPLTVSELIDYIQEHHRGTVDSEVINALRRFERIEDALETLNSKGWK